ncbi:MAG: hypothetical protein GY719_22700, partial [bacterium]|nr:hypothetical protein [bacterium]
PVTACQFKRAGGGAPHLDPLAEDLAGAFEVGTGRGVPVGGASGVALSAIQGLHAELTDKDAQIETLTGRLAELESLVGQLVAQ